MRSSRSLGDLKGSLLKGSERVRKHSTGERKHRRTQRNATNPVRPLDQLEWHYSSIMRYRVVKIQATNPSEASSVAYQYQFATLSMCSDATAIGRLMSRYSTRFVRGKKGKLEVKVTTVTVRETPVQSRDNVLLRQQQLSACHFD